MPKELFVAELTAGFDTLPPQLKEAARWVIDHPADVALLTMREQARRAGIPPATLTRLAQRKLSRPLRHGLVTRSVFEVPVWAG